MKQAEDDAIDSIGKVAAGIKSAFAFVIAAIARVFLVSMVLAVIAFLAALMLPAIPLRTGAPGGPPSE